MTKDGHQPDVKSRGMVNGAERLVALDLELGEWCSGELAAALSDCSQLTQLCPTGPEVTEPRWPKRYLRGGLSVSLQGVAADTISHLADLGRRVNVLEIYDCTDHTAGSLEPLTRCPGLEGLSVTAADLPLLKGSCWRASDSSMSEWCSGELAAALSDCSQLTQLCPTGLEVTEPRWPEWYGDLSVSLQGVTADTISHLADLGRTVRLLEIYDCPDLTAGSLEPLTRCPGLRWLTLSGGVPDTVSLEPLTRCRRLSSLTLSGGVPDTVSLEPLTRCTGLERLSVSAVDLPRLRGQLPEGLERLNVRGPEVTEPRWPERYPWGGLSVSLQGVTADTISHLADLGRTVRLLEIYDCPDLTAGSLEPLTWCPELYDLTLSGGVPDTVSLEPLTRCPELVYLTLSGGVPDTVSLEPLTRCPGLWCITLSGGVPDAVLDSLSGCPGLLRLTLGDLQRPAETAFTAAAVTRLVKSCRKLCALYLHCTADTGRAVLTALKEADLGRDSDGEPRTIYLSVPEELYRQLESQEGDGVEVFEWED
ncbi:hypothetical protein FJT64_018976 [Amphibalanus amphitrite]|uniref:F-box/LRR-repeat protein 20 n=1 Tax=Amphibalanus amphitrite TaxID=1232801 RepID=A0A6A4WR39_AMPAM|nr:hypothetical protein FJT64_018976 [Amphibalanus amphitrite]